MASKSNSNPRAFIRTPEARYLLQRWLRGLPTGVASRGRDYYAEHRVTEAWADSHHAFQARVLGGEEYQVTVRSAAGEWTATCTCPMERDCKHTVAAAFAWIAHGGADFDEADRLDGPFEDDEEDEDDLIAPMIQFAPLEKEGHGSPKKGSFRTKWAPVLAQKLGRPLREEEEQLLGRLAAIFAEFNQAQRQVTAYTLRLHGLADAIPSNAPPWGPVFPGWWHPASPPADPWELWQYIAFSLERNGHSIPEVMKPMTNTRAVSAALDKMVQDQEIKAWREAMTVAPRSVAEATSPLRREIAGLRARITPKGTVVLEVRPAADKPWKRPGYQWLSALTTAKPSDFEGLSPAEAALAITVGMVSRRGFNHFEPNGGLAPEVAAAILTSTSVQPAVVLPDGKPFTLEPQPLVPEAVVAADQSHRLSVQLVTPEGVHAAGAVLIIRDPRPLYLFEGRVWPGPPPFPSTPLPIAALGDASLMTRLRQMGLRLPKAMTLKHRIVPLRPRLRVWLSEPPDAYQSQSLCVQLTALSTDPACEQQWSGVGGWNWTETGAPPRRGPDDPIWEFDLSLAQEVGGRFSEFRLMWNHWSNAWTRSVARNFPEELLAWRASLPEGVEIDASPEVAAFFKPGLRAHVDFSALAADSAHDWFDITVALRVEDTQLSPEEIALLLKAKGKWVRLPKRGWQRLEIDGVAAGSPAATVLDRLGLTVGDVLETGKAATHRVHALQLASEVETLEARDEKLARALRDRVAKLKAAPPAVIPATLTAMLRPYQQEGFQFLAHLSSLGFGGVLADDMGLGKTVQALAWLLHLCESRGRSPSGFRALVVCPKSVMHGWRSEALRFAPTLATDVFAPTSDHTEPEGGKPWVLIANYTQLRLRQEWFGEIAWDAVILDEGQFIKNPSSQAANVARGLRARHRLVLTGTPVENRLTDLWSLFAFAQPGLLGAQAGFRRQYDEKDSAALERLHRRVRHFLLRRTKAQAAPDLPARTEDEITVDLEPAQRKLYDAELKRARQQLLGIESDRALDKVRFNILSSLLRLRQICCHPALLDPVHAETSSAKLEALLERLEELRDEGHQVLVFSQFVEMLEIIRGRLSRAGIGHLILTGATENRAELVEQFQTDRSKTVFLLSLKAAGFGLNLTAASYAVLYDPWWNPAVEAQAIDRTHRIGQTRAVMAYRFLARDTVEQKIRLLQQEKAALASAVVQEESLASVLDLESLRRILS